MKSKKRSSSEEAAVQKDISDEAKGEEPGLEDGVIATAPIPDSAAESGHPASQSTKRPAPKTTNTTRSRRAASRTTKGSK